MICIKKLILKIKQSDYMDLTYLAMLQLLATQNSAPKLVIVYIIMTTKSNIDVLSHGAILNKDSIIQIYLNKRGHDC